MSHERILELLRRDVDLEEYAEIRELWKQHSIAEDKRDLGGLLSTLTDECVYELPQLGRVWRGLDGAAAFYTELLSAFPDIHFDLRSVVIGPQGVAEEADVTGTHLGEWMGRAATGEPLSFRVVIFFPWNREKKKFDGERVIIDSPELVRLSTAS